MTALATKRMTRERQMLQTENEDYFAFFHNDNLLSFDAYVVGPDDSLYRHKLVKLHFEIPHNYPMVPPKVKFVQHTGSRIHPNFYVEGNVCLSILGTWAGEPWTFSMNCNTVLITIRSLLDNKPYLHEPGKDNHPEFNHYVQYCTWRSLLLDYLRHESDASAKSFLHKFVTSRASGIMADLQAQQAANAKRKLFSSPYSSKSPIAPDYPSLTGELRDLIKHAELQITAAAAAATETAAATATAAPAAPETEEVAVVPRPIAASAPVLAAGSAQAPVPTPVPAQLAPDRPQKQHTKRAVSAVTGVEDEEQEAPASKRTRNKESGDVRAST